MLPGKGAGHLPLTMLVSLGLVMMAATTRAAPGPGPGAPVPVLDRGLMGHTVALPGGQRAYRAEGKARAVSVLDPRTGAPPFSLPAHTGEQVSLTDYVGKRDVVLVFYMFST